MATANPGDVFYRSTSAEVTAMDTWSICSDCIGREFRSTSAEVTAMDTGERQVKLVKKEDLRSTSAEVTAMDTQAELHHRREPADPLNLCPRSRPWTPIVP